MVYHCLEVRATAHDKGLALVQVSLTKNRSRRFGCLGDRVRGFEVWVLKLRSDSYFEKYGVKWRFPSNEEFGMYAWSFQSKEAALRKIGELMID